MYIIAGDPQRAEGSGPEQRARPSLRDRGGSRPRQAAVRPPPPRRLLRHREGSELP